MLLCSIRQFLGKKIVKPLYKFHDWFTYSGHDYCEICGLPIRSMKRGGNFKSLSRPHPLFLQRTGHELYSVCQFCRKTNDWDTVAESYRKTWKKINRTNMALILPFDTDDVEKAIMEDKGKVTSKLDVKFWVDQIEKVYNSTTSWSEYCSFEEGKQMSPDFETAVRILINVKKLDIKIVNENNRTRIILWESTRKKSIPQKVIELPRSL